jgi:hypothetical protein
MNGILELLFKQAGGYVETDDQGNQFTYTQDFDPEKFAHNTIMECYQTLINHGYTDAAECLKNNMVQ